MPQLAWVAVIAAVTLMCYAPVLHNFFYEIDDSGHLLAIAHGKPNSPHLRPLHFWWNDLLYHLFGVDPLPYYAAGILLHLMNAILVLVLVQSLSGELLPAAVAGMTFAAWYAPHQTVLWISASCGLLSVLFVLLAAVAHVRFRKTGRVRFLVLSLLSAMAAMASKEDSMILIPLLIASDATLRGWRSLIDRSVLLGYVPLALLVIVFLCLALRPSLWAERPDVGRYALDASVIPKLLRSFAWLFWPQPARSGNESRTVAAIGFVLLCAFVALAFHMARHRRLFALGLVIAVAGFFPVLPGPFALLGDRYAYPSTIGVAIMFGAAGAWLWKAIPAMARPVLALGFAGLIAGQMLAIHSVTSWRYARCCTRLLNLVQSTRAQLSEADGAEALVIAPVIYSVDDYVHAVELFLGWPDDHLSLETLPWDEHFAERFETGGLDLSRQHVYACRGDGVIYRLNRMEDAPLDWWRQLALAREKQGRRRSLSLIRFAPLTAPMSADRCGDK
jgi:hypothetical protein